MISKQLYIVKLGSYIDRSLLSMRLTLPIAIHFIIKDHKFIKIKYL